MILLGREIPKTGWFHLFYGCMFSGKTGSLIVALNRFEAGGHSIQLYRPTIDVRYHATHVMNHDGFHREATVVNSSCPNEMLEQIDPNAVVIGIDEIQFFSSGIVQVVDTLTRDLGKVVIAAGLNTDFRRQPFGLMSELMVRANTADSLFALCSVCGKPATWTQRIINGIPAHQNDPIVLVGANEAYEARCGDCHVVRTD